MTVVDIIDKLTDWTQENICSKIKLKVPTYEQPVGKTQNPITHAVQFVHPTAFPLYFPPKENIAPGVAVQNQFPSICVQALEGEDDLTENIRTISVRLCLGAWNPGIQTDELLIPTVDLTKDIPRKWHQGKDTDKGYFRNFDGWRDVYNLMDIALRVIENAENLSGLGVVVGESIKYGPFIEGDVVTDYYPYWHAYISFKVKCGLIRAIEI